MTWQRPLKSTSTLNITQKIVQGAKNEAPLANFVSLLKCIDNVPAHYTVQDFAREVLQLLVETPKSCVEKLEKHLEKTTRSY